MEERWRRINDRMAHICRQQRQLMGENFQHHDILPSQHYVLMQLKRMGRIPSQAQMAEMMHVSGPCVARTLKSLDAEGYIRRDSGADGRKNEISITEKGERVVRDSQAHFQRLDAATYAGISAEELALLDSLLERILTNLSRLAEGLKRS